MIEHRETLIADDVMKEFFACDLRMCKGACCVEGDEGAPIDPIEIQQITNNLDTILEGLDEEHGIFIKENGFYEKDDDGELVTKCLDNGECCFVKKASSGILGCGIEHAYYKNNTDFIKPISCHLYPIRIKQYESHTFLNYHEWHLCSDACAKGNQKGIKLYEFVEPALRRRFGDVWYEELAEINRAQSDL